MKRLVAAFILAVSSLGAQSQVSNTTANPLPSAAYTATTVNSGDQNNPSWVGAHFIINVSAYTSGSYTPHIQGKDPVSGLYYDVLVGTAISATGTTILKVHPGLAVVANGSASDILPQTWRVQLVGASTPSMTLSVSAYLEN